MRALLSRLRLVLAQFGVDPLRTARALAALPRYLRDWQRFARDGAARGGAVEMRAYPCLLDRTAGAATLGEYFWQDLYVARRIIEQAPRRHVDVGSRIDGFVAHLACVRPVEVCDIRPLEVAIPNVSFRRWDLMADGPIGASETADCVSCLHTLEHIGLGRYGDRIDAGGWRVALRRLAALVAPGGRLWLSMPVGRPRVEFNAHRVFEVQEVIAAAAAEGLALVELSTLDDQGRHRFPAGPDAIAGLRREDYALGICLFARAAMAAPALPPGDRA